MSKLWFWREEVSSTTTWVHHVEGDMSLVCVKSGNVTEDFLLKFDPFLSPENQSIQKAGPRKFAAHPSPCFFSGCVRGVWTDGAFNHRSIAIAHHKTNEGTMQMQSMQAGSTFATVNQSFGSKTPLQYFSAIDRFNLSADGTTTTTLRLEPLES